MENYSGSHSQECDPEWRAGMAELKEVLPILQIISQGGLALVIFVIWYFTFKKSNETAKEAFDKHAKLSESLIQLLKDEQEYKTMLAGILMRLEEKLYKPVACPIKRGDDNVH